MRDGLTGSGPAGPATLEYSRTAREKALQDYRWRSAHTPPSTRLVLVLAGPHGRPPIGIHQIHQMRQLRIARIETINHKTRTDQRNYDDQRTHKYQEGAPTALRLRRIGRGSAGQDEFSQGCCGPASIRTTVASPRRRASTPKTTKIAIAEPASGHTSHIGYMISGAKAVKNTTSSCDCTLARS
jgi:hypothetical protein